MSFKSEIVNPGGAMKWNILIAGLMFFAASSLIVSARTPAKQATLRVESHTEADGEVTMDGQRFCSLPNHKQCTASVSPGTHEFKIVFHDKDDPPERIYTVKTSGSFRAGEHRAMSVDTDGATWQ
jgi:hypothetical protein